MFINFEFPYRLETKLRLYQTYTMPFLMYGCETWATTKYLFSRLDAFDTWMGTTEDLEDIVYSPRKSEEPLVVHRFLTW